MALSMRSKVSPVARSTSRRTTVPVRAAIEPQVAISGATLAMLTLGRFVFLPYQRREAQFDDVGPKTTGNTFYDKLQTQSSFTTSSKDPAGFTVVDVFGWGALGHALGYFILAANSLNEAGISAFPR